MWRKWLLIVVMGAFVLTLGCSELANQLLDDSPAIPTADLLPGVWKVTEAIRLDDSTSFLAEISRPIPAYFWLTRDQSISSTAGALWTYIVYGKSSFVNTLGVIDNFLNYVNLDYNGGEYGVGEGVVDHIAVELKLFMLGTVALKDFLGLLGVPALSIVNTILYHKFLDVDIEISDDGQTMTWLIDDNSAARYNYKVAGPDVIKAVWDGVSVSTFTRCEITLTKQLSTLNVLVNDAYNPTP